MLTDEQAEVLLKQSLERFLSAWERIAAALERLANQEKPNG
jgi:hypothetical protein